MPTEARPVTLASVHAWNADRTLCAVSPNSKEIVIYAVSSDKKTWTEKHVLQGHDQPVTGIDWAAKTNRIVSCAQDRTAYVWNLEEGEWKPTLVLAHLTHAATCVKWSPKEDKFAIGSSAKLVAVCSYEAQGNWWVCKQIKKHTSAVLSVAWHPSNVILATGCADFRCRVITAAVRGVDKRTGHDTPFGEKIGFGELLAEFPTRGWVHDVSWSPDGKQLAYATHDSSVSFVKFGGDAPATSTVRLRTLPLRNIMFMSNAVAVGTGWELSPTVFVAKGDSWQETLLDTGAGAASAESQTKVSSVAATLAMFQATATRGQAKTDISVKTVHQNTVLCAQRYGKNSFTTSGLDGKIVFWELDTLSDAMAALSL